MKAVAARIEAILRVLSDFQRLRNEGRTRGDYLQVLKADISYYYGYVPDLVELIVHLFGPHEAVEYLEASETPRPVTLRVNTLKARRQDVTQALTKRGANLEPIEWSKEGIQVFESTVPLGATPEYLAGYYMIQSAASWTPVLALGAQPNERILDMAAAPVRFTSFLRGI